MNVEITINYEFTKRKMEEIANDYLQLVVDSCNGDEVLYREKYKNLLDNDDTDLLTFIDDYEFLLNDDGNYFTGFQIEVSQRFDLCNEIKKIVLKYMKEDLKNF